MAPQSHRLTREERRVRNREALLRAAEKLFAARGVSGASLDDVAAEAGLTKGAVYSNFANKEDLILAVLQWRESGQMAADTAALLASGRSAEQLIADYSALWAAASSTAQPDSARLDLAFLSHATQHPEMRRRLLDLMLGPNEECDITELVPPDSEMARLPGHQVRVILQALNVGMGVMAQLDPLRCPPELYGVALRLLTGIGLDPRRPYPPVGGEAEDAATPGEQSGGDAGA